MPIATIDAEGTQYAFTDSPIHGQVYKTLMIFHGTVFNGCNHSRHFLGAVLLTSFLESFEPLVPLFNRRGVRVLNISRRSYGATSEHSATDIANLAAGNSAFLKVLARDVANLLVWVLDNLGPFEETQPTYDWLVYGDINDTVIIRAEGHCSSRDLFQDRTVLAEGDHLWRVFSLPFPSRIPNSSDDIQIRRCRRMDLTYQNNSIRSLLVSHRNQLSWPPSLC